MSTQQAYWESMAASAAFTHPLDEAWLARWFRPDFRILDYGCGYGRLMRQLSGLGYSRLVGVDFSPAMVARGHAESPDLDLRLATQLPLPEPDGGFDAALLFAVLTCMPDDAAQVALIGELKRLVRPGGLIWVSDLMLQSDARNRERYEANAALGSHGLFPNSEDVVMRHHDGPWIDTLFDGLERLSTRTIPSRSITGHPYQATQWLLRR